MSDAHVELIRAGNEAWNAGDMATVRENLDPDVILRTVGNWPEPGPYMGRDAVMGFYESLREAWDADALEEVGGYVHAGDRAAVRVRWCVEGHGPDQSSELTMLYEIRQGKVRSVEFFWDNDEAMKAIGLAE